MQSLYNEAGSHAQVPIPAFFFCAQREELATSKTRLDLTRDENAKLHSELKILTVSSHLWCVT